MPIFNRCRKNLILLKKFEEDLTGLNWISNPLRIGNCGQLALNGLAEKRCIVKLDFGKMKLDLEHTHFGGFS